MNETVITGGSSIDADEVFSRLKIAREVSADKHETTCHIFIAGTFCRSALAWGNRDISDANDSRNEPRCGAAALDDLLANNHPLETPSDPNIVGFDDAQQLAKTANQAAT